MQITRICKSLIIIILKNMIIFLKKHVHVFHKSRTCFSENTYTFLPGHTTEDKNPSPNSKANRKLSVEPNQEYLVVNLFKKVSQIPPP